MSGFRYPIYDYIPSIRLYPKIYDYIRSIYSDNFSQNHHRISFREQAHGISGKAQVGQSKLFFISN